MKPIRNSIKAIIRRGDRVLMIRCHDTEGDFYILPGGGQRPREAMEQTLERECLEELGCAVTVGPLRYVCEYILPQKTYDWQKSLHQIEFMFRCTLPPGAEPQGGTAPDSIQTGTAWVPIFQLESLRHYPAGLASALLYPEDTPVYWGDVAE